MLPRLTIGALLVAALAACGADDPQPLPHDQATPARNAIASYARDHADDFPAKFTSGAQYVVANRDCFAADYGRIYCAVSFEDFPNRFERWCVTGFTATRAGTDVRHVKIGDPTGPGWECGNYPDADPFA